MGLNGAPPRPQTILQTQLCALRQSGFDSFINEIRALRPGKVVDSDKATMVDFLKSLYLPWPRDKYCPIKSEEITAFIWLKRHVYELRQTPLESLYLEMCAFAKVASAVHQQKFLYLAMNATLGQKFKPKPKTKRKRLPPFQPIV